MHGLKGNKDAMQLVFIRTMLSVLGCVVWRGRELELGLERSEVGSTGGQNSIQATHKPGQVIRAYAMQEE